MSELSKLIADLPPEQEAIRAKCFHSTGTFEEFQKAEIEQSIPERFEKIVRKYPDRIAVKTSNQTLTYAELNAMANGLAHALVNERGPEAEPVALLFDNDAPLMASILGVLKAGKFFVLLDPLFPTARIAAVLEDSQARLIATNQKNLSVASELPRQGSETLNIDMIGCRYSNENMGLSLASASLAATIYTSGSTGKPKGVVQNHRNILHYTMVRTNVLHICDHDRLGLPASGTAGALFPTARTREGLGTTGCWRAGDQGSSR